MGTGRVMLINEIPRECTPSTVTHIYNIFSLYGPIKKVNLLFEKGTCMIEYYDKRDCQEAYNQLNNLKFFTHQLYLKPSKHEAIAAPVGKYCREFSNNPTFIPSKAPSKFVHFDDLHPIVCTAPCIPIALCHYFDHYYVPRPIDTIFETAKFVHFLTSFHILHHHQHRCRI